MRISPKQIERMARRMGIQTQPIDAKEVIIKTPDKEIIISNPQVAKVNLMGQETYQITGEVSEKAKEKFTLEDVKLVAKQANVTRAEAEKALEQTDDIAKAILKLKEFK